MEATDLNEARDAVRLLAMWWLAVVAVFFFWGLSLWRASKAIHQLGDDLQNARRALLNAEWRSGTESTPITAERLAAAGFDDHDYGLFVMPMEGFDLCVKAVARTHDQWYAYLRREDDEITLRDVESMEEVVAFVDSMRGC